MGGAVVLVLEGRDELLLGELLLGVGVVVGDGVVARTTDGGSVSTVASGAVAVPSTSELQPTRSTAHRTHAEPPYARSRFIPPA